MYEYRYHGSKLIPTVFKELIIKFYNGKRFNRDEAIEKIVDYHINGGGLELSREPAKIFDNAIDRLKEDSNYEIKNISTGTWQLNNKRQENMDGKYKDIINRSIDILTKSLDSDEEQLRVNAAAALLNYFK